MSVDENKDGKILDALMMLKYKNDPSVEFLPFSPEDIGGCDPSELEESFKWMDDDMESGC